MSHSIDPLVPSPPASPPPTPPRQVLLFSGHRVDAPGRARPRFAPAMLPGASAAIGAALDALGAGPDDVALSQAAAGGDLLFGEACIARRVPLHWLLPLAEPAFIAESVLDAGGDWYARYRDLRARLAEPPQAMPDELGPLPAHVNVFERCNRWLLDAALAHGAEKLRVICLWDGGEGDGPGGTAHMLREARRYTARVTWIDTRNLLSRGPHGVP